MSADEIKMKELYDYACEQLRDSRKYSEQLDTKANYYGSFFAIFLVAISLLFQSWVTLNSQSMDLLSYVSLTAIIISFVILLYGVYRIVTAVKLKNLWRPSMSSDEMGEFYDKNELVVIHSGLAKQYLDNCQKNMNTLSEKAEQLKKIGMLITWLVAGTLLSVLAMLADLLFVAGR